MANPTIPCASLYVGDLHPEVTEAILFEKFQTHGNVLSIRVCRDLVTRKSLGYAYVNFQTNQEAKSALDNLNFDDIHGRPCRIMWSQRDPATRRSGVGNIFIKNLDPTITIKEISDTFSIFGEITSCKVESDENGASKGFAYVNFAQQEDAEKAIQAINGKIIRDKIVYVGKFVPRNQRTSTTKDYTNCYVKNFSTYLTEQNLYDLFSAYGEIVSAKVMLDREGISKGFGFVSFQEHQQAVKAVEQLNGHAVQDRIIVVCRFMKKNERQREIKARFEKTRQERQQQHKSGVNLYIKNLSFEITDDRLCQEFSIFGNITSAKVMINRDTNISKGFGFVCFSAPDEATRAVSEMNGKIIDGKPLYVALAQKKEDRREHLRIQFQQRIYPVQHQTQQPFNPMHNYFMPPQNQQRPFLPRHGQGLPPRWEPALNFLQSSRPNIMGNQNLYFQQQQQMRNTRAIVGNIQSVAQTRPPYSAVARIAPPLVDDLPASQCELTAASTKESFGDRLYPRVGKHACEMAGKITGMFLELDNNELLWMLKDEERLRVKINEAMAVLDGHKTEGPQL